MTATDTTGDGRRRLGRFAGGFLVGLLILPALAAIAWLALIATGWLHMPGPEVGPTVNVSGADLSAYGTRSATFRMSGVDVRQDCAGACDDLRFEPSSDGQLWRVDVLDANGACVLCSAVDYAKSTRESIPSWEIGGRPLSVSGGRTK